MEALNNAILAIMDVLLGWMLALPRDIVLIIVAVATSAILTFVRPLVTNQEILRRCKRDKNRLGELIKEAKLRGDKDAIRRHRTTMALIAMQSMKAEGKPLLAAILPIAILCVWCFARLSHLAPKPAEAVDIKAYFPASAIGKVAQMLPQDGLTVENGWVQRIVEDRPAEDSAKKAATRPDGEAAGGPATKPAEDQATTADAKINGIAIWKIVPQPEKLPHTYKVQIRFEDELASREYLAHSRHYSVPVELFPDRKISAVEYALTPYRPLGLLPDLPLYFMSMDAWLFGYLIIAIPVAFLLRWMFKVC